ncbi:MAG TPA: tryptophan synthase subunit alpha [Thermoanaerobaculia bacterium]|nr:tryptophan synthase subunit alpha [Thermoanaerobaculia bacterium]
MTASRIAAAFELAAGERRSAFIGYLTAGDPAAGGTLALARSLDRAGADVLELGVPFSDPIADGPVLQRSAERSLAAGTNLPAVWRLARAIRRESATPLVLFSYLNPLLRRGLERSAAEAKAAGFDAVLVTDLPPEEAGEIQPLLRSAFLDTVFLVSPTSSVERMRSAARLSSGFLYVVSRAGTTGARDFLPPTLPATIVRARRARSGGRLPIAVGFGISTPAAALAAGRLADGVVVGSALVAAAETGGRAAFETLSRRLAAACRRATPPRTGGRP